MKGFFIFLGFILLACAAVFLLMYLTGCSECTPSEVRCQGDVLEICDGDEQWFESQDCSEILSEGGAAWMCCQSVDAGEPECLPSEDCQ